MFTLETQKWKQFTPQDMAAQETKLRETLHRAYDSPLYRKLWKTAGFKPDLLGNLSDLNKLPLLDRKYLFEATRAKQSSICVAPVCQWFLCSEQATAHEWYPYSEADFNEIAPLLYRLSSMVGLKRGDVVLAVVDTPPKISAVIPYLWSYSSATKDLGLEFIEASMEWYETLEMSWINFIQKRQPTAIIASAKNARALADKIQTMGTTAKDAFAKARVGIFYGDHLEIELTKNLEPYSRIETFEVYAPTEHMAFFSECSSHSGVHIWLDTCIPEVLAANSKNAQLLTDAKVGTKGELVLTNFSEALPLVRYRTGQQVCVEAECSCGCMHPKVKFLPKSPVSV